MSARPYRASGRYPRGALPGLAAAALLGGLGAGIVEGVIGQWISLLLIFPGLIGLGAGGVTASRVTKARVRAPLLVAILAVTGALLGQATTHAFDYVRFRWEVAEIIAAEPPGWTVDDVLASEGGHPGVLGYVAIMAHNGISIARMGGSDESGPTFTGAGAYVFWGLEFGVAALVAGFMAAGAAREPYCEACDHWYDRNDVLLVGGATRGAWKPLADAIDTGDWLVAVRGLGPAEPSSACVVRLVGCGTCADADQRPVLAIDVLTGINTKKSATKTHFTALLRPDEAAMLRLAVVTSPPTAA
jgi:hypothetical protein